MPTTAGRALRARASVLAGSAAVLAQPATVRVSHGHHHHLHGYIKRPDLPPTPPSGPPDWSHVIALAVVLWVIVMLFGT